jgi:hypothetical protein
LRPANAKAIENAAATINKLRLSDTTVGDYTRLHRAAHIALHYMNVSHYHATVLMQMHSIRRGIDDIPEMSAIVLQYSKIDDPTNASITELCANIQQHPPAHHVGLAQADSVCAVCDRAGHNATSCRTKAFLFENGRINPAAIVSPSTDGLFFAICRHVMLQRIVVHEQESLRERFSKFLSCST